MINVIGMIVMTLSGLALILLGRRDGVPAQVRLGEVFMGAGAGLLVLWLVTS